MAYEPERSIFLALAGSRAQGTARPSSDVDLRGVCVMPIEVRLSLFQRFEQTERLPKHDRAALEAYLERSKLVAKDVESVVFDIAKFLRLCAKANPNALELLFTDRQDWLRSTPAWQTLHAQRHRFLTKRVKATFAGYAATQLRRIRGHRKWLRGAPPKKPSKHELAKDGEGRAAYDAALGEWRAFNQWQRERNPARAALERAHGYDTKHAMHLVRLMRMGEEALRTGELQTRRPDAKELVGIRDGALSYDGLLELTAALQDGIEQAHMQSELPEDVEEGAVDALLLHVLEVDRRTENA